jgi:hypothetical protein
MVDLGPFVVVDKRQAAPLGVMGWAGMIVRSLSSAAVGGTSGGQDTPTPWNPTGLPHRFEPTFYYRTDSSWDSVCTG